MKREAVGAEAHEGGVQDDGADVTGVADHGEERIGWCAPVRRHREPVADEGRRGEPIISHSREGAWIRENWLFATFNTGLLKIATFNIGFAKMPSSSCAS